MYMAWKKKLKTASYMTSLHIHSQCMQCIKRWIQPEATSNQQYAHTNTDVNYYSFFLGPLTDVLGEDCLVQFLLQCWQPCVQDDLTLLREVQKYLGREQGRKKCALQILYKSICTYMSAWGTYMYLCAYMYLYVSMGYLYVPICQHGVPIWPIWCQHGVPILL